MFGYTNNKVSEKKAMKTIPYTTASKRVKHLGINLTKEVKLLYTQNYKSFWYLAKLIQLCSVKKKINLKKKKSCGHIWKKIK